MMLGFTYKDLSSSEKQTRRESLDSIGRNTVLSQLIILIVTYIYHLCIRRQPLQVRFLRKLEWQLTKPISWNSPESKSLADWTVGGGWIGWMIWLTFREAGDDYLHLTKAFGMAAAANFPLHVFLSMKRMPLRHTFSVSYEGKINHLHQGLGKITGLLLGAHVCLYLKFFWDTRQMKKRLFDFDILCGLLGFTLLSIIIIASNTWVRKYYYRIFYILHHTLPPFLFSLFYLHVSHLRPYILASLAFFAYDRLLRALTSMNAIATIHHLSPNTLHISISSLKIPSTPAPISHLLLSVPRVSPWTKNPFTIADFSQEEGKIQIIVRIRNGFTKRLASVAASSEEEQMKVAVAVDMHYGKCMNYTALASQFNCIMIVTGGVGGVFAMPWLKYLANIPGALGRTKFIWVMRDTTTISWAMRSSTAADAIKKKVEVYITPASNNQEGSREDMEVQDTRLLESYHYQEEVITELEKLGVTKENVNFGRPNLENALKGITKHGSVAVLVCGPWGLGTRVRKTVGERVRAGGEVWIHVEEFGS